MATWEDGPEYAPLERPAAFTSPAAEPLDEAPPPVQPAAGAPVERPQFAGPAAPVAPLATLVPVVADVRDPGQPFAVVASNLTSAGAWGSAHGSSAHGGPAQAGAPLGGPPQPGTPPAPPVPVALPGTAYTPEALPAPAPVAAQQWPEPAPVPGGYPPAAPGAYPAPGTPQWFGPGPYGEQPRGVRVGPRQVIDAATPTLLLVLLVGGLIFVLAPLAVGAAFALRSRVSVAQHQVRRTLSTALGAVGFFAFVGLLQLPLGFSEWWRFVGLWSLLISWASLVSILLLVRAALRRRPVPPPPSYPNPWR